MQYLSFELAKGDPKANFECNIATVILTLFN